LKKVVFLGDFNVDIIMDGLKSLPVPDREIGCASFDLAMGASSCITACAYASLGGEAWCCSLSGDDSFGSFMREGLASHGVHSTHVRRDPSVGTGVTVNLVRGTERYQITYPGSMARFGPEHISDDMFDGLDHLHVSGVYQTRGLLPHVAGLLARAARAGATTSMDCQWDANARWEGLAEWLPLLDVLFANVHEARSMTGAPDAWEALAALAARTRCPVVKQGAQGASAVVDGRLMLVPAIPVSVVDTIGAGDNFTAGFLYARLEERKPLLTCLRAANAAAGRSCAFRGGTAARTTWQEVARIMETSA
jgi:sugar/nucleoside kinase (ribokinase family)